MPTYLITGAAGFIGAKVSALLLASGHTVVGIDNLNDAYDVRLKQWRLAQMQGKPGFEFHQLDICDRAGLSELFTQLATRPSPLSGVDFFEQGCMQGKSCVAAQLAVPPRPPKIGGRLAKPGGFPPNFGG